MAGRPTSIGPPWRTISISSSRCGKLVDERIDPLHVRMRVERVGSGWYGTAPELISDRGRGGGTVVVGGLPPPTRSVRAILAIGELPDPDDGDDVLSAGDTLTLTFDKLTDGPSHAAVATRVELDQLVHLLDL